MEGGNISNICVKLWIWSSGSVGEVAEGYKGLVARKPDLFSLELFDMRVEKAAVFFDKIFNLMLLLCFSVIRWNFGIILVLFNGGVLLLVEWT